MPPFGAEYFVIFPCWFSRESMLPFGEEYVVHFPLELPFDSCHRVQASNECGCG